jgi:CMP-N-acetylneuraminic acid synthetase
MAVIAFIPVRGGSKSIPLKNIKILNGKPLICWSIEELLKCDNVDSVIVATDSDEIEQTVLSRNYNKTSIYRRLPENATDTASTESVMIEYIENHQLKDDDVFVLVQATSPLTKRVDFSGALEMHKSIDYDSILSSVRYKRFLWNEDGTTINYDYLNRPRRQDFKGVLLENGAFYINSVGNILKYKNRLSGRIGIYEMPSYTAIELDEPEDWHIMEGLMQRLGFY